jgi:hypothetical protein
LGEPQWVLADAAAVAAVATAVADVATADVVVAVGACCKGSLYYCVALRIKKEIKLL